MPSVGSGADEIQLRMLEHVFLIPVFAPKIFACFLISFVYGISSNGENTKEESYEKQNILYFILILFPDFRFHFGCIAFHPFLIADKGIVQLRMLEHVFLIPVFAPKIFGQ